MTGLMPCLAWVCAHDNPFPLAKLAFRVVGTAVCYEVFVELCGPSALGWKTLGAANTHS